MEGGEASCSVRLARRSYRDGCSHSTTSAIGSPSHAGATRVRNSATLHGSGEPTRDADAAAAEKHAPSAARGQPSTVIGDAGHAPSVGDDVEAGPGVNVGLGLATSVAGRRDGRRHGRRRDRRLDPRLTAGTPGDPPGDNDRSDGEERRHPVARRSAHLDHTSPDDRRHWKTTTHVRRPRGDHDSGPPRPPHARRRRAVTAPSPPPASAPASTSRHRRRRRAEPVASPRRAGLVGERVGAAPPAPGQVAKREPRRVDRAPRGRVAG